MDENRRLRVFLCHGENTFHMTISIGIAQYKIHEEDWQKQLERADQALYRAKNQGRDQWATA